MKQQNKNWNEGLSKEKRFWNWVAILVIMVLAFIGVTVVVDKAFGASATTQMCLMPKATTQMATVCPGAGKKHAKLFREGDKGNSKTVKFPFWVKKKINNQNSRFAKDDDHWWDAAFSGARCLAYWNTYGDCSRTNERLDKIEKKTFKVVVGCSGEALIATFLFWKGGAKRPGLLGAGAGAIGCMWRDFFDSFL